MDQARYDLHCHTHFSDGTKTPEELMEIARKFELSGLSITDHDTLDAYPEAIQAAKKYDLKLLPGIEFSAQHQEKSVHVLAYSFNLENIHINALVDKCALMRKKRNAEMIEKIKEEGFDISLEDVREVNDKYVGVIGRPHFANCLFKKGYVPSIQAAFNHYLADKEKCFVPGYRPHVSEVIEIIHQANGFAIIAHPHLCRDNSLMKQLLKMNFDGLEAFYAKFLPKDEKKWVGIAKDKNWIMTGGSDFHGDNKSHIHLGSSWIEEETFSILYKRHLENERV